MSSRRRLNFSIRSTKNTIRSCSHTSVSRALNSSIALPEAHESARRRIQTTANRADLALDRSESRLLQDHPTDSCLSGRLGRSDLLALGADRDRERMNCPVARPQSARSSTSHFGTEDRLPAGCRIAGVRSVAAPALHDIKLRWK